MNRNDRHDHQHTDTSAADAVIPEPMRTLHRWGAMIVPWAVRWTMTAPEHEQIGYDPALGAVATCDCIPGQGKPQFGKLCYERLRRSMTERLCGLCGTPLDRIGAWPADNDSQTWSEPPSHPACLAYAFTTCPELKANLAQRPGFGVVEAPAYHLHAERSPNRAETGPWNYFRPGVPVEVQQLLGGMLHTFSAEPIDRKRFGAVSWLARQRKLARRNQAR